MARIRDIELVQQREKQILNFLFDYGPHRKEQIEQETDLTEAVITRTMEHLKAEGKVTFFKRGNHRYWILATDA